METKNEQEIVMENVTTEAKDYSGSKRQTGVCKWFNVKKGWGFISPENGEPDVFVHQRAIKMTGFRSLAEGEEVEFVAVNQGKGPEAVLVTGVGGGDCVGSPIKPKGKPKIKCYNCGVLGMHIANKCQVTSNKNKCHICLKEDHLKHDCPQKDASHSKTPASIEDPSNHETNASENHACRVDITTEKESKTNETPIDN